ncbi:neurogenic differentiation factor 1-like [Diaphorina citri]|uniref:Neurogenic differentiation factor 1-like n=1 Tax=Diaphorina citri TaxID=121845 RepID=A0A3Q0IN72_DIACI|nr:neurogenic differentiation factor 1-like [Diaphorina citri]
MRNLYSCGGQLSLGQVLQTVTYIPAKVVVFVSNVYNVFPDLPIIRVVKRRNTANKKERRRTQSINNAFSDLRECIPNVPSDTKLSKIKTLRLATSYISYLMKILETDDIISIDDFKADLSNHSSHRKNKSQYDSPSEISSNQSSQYVMDPSCQQYLLRYNYSTDFRSSDLQNPSGYNSLPRSNYSTDFRSSDLQNPSGSDATTLETVSEDAESARQRLHGE